MSFPPYYPCKFNDCGGDLSKNWYVYYRVLIPNSDGKYETKTHYISMHFKTKRNRMQELNRQIRYYNEKLYSGWNPLKIQDENKKPSKLNTPILEALQTAYKYRMRNVKSDSIRTYDNFFRIITGWLKKNKYHRIPAQLINEDHALEWFYWIEESRKLSNRTLANYRAVAITFWNMLKQHRFVKDNPFEQLPKIKFRRLKWRGMDPVTRDRIKTFIQEKDPDLYNYILFEYYGFIRPNELSFLKFNMVDLDNGYIKLPAEICKDSEDRCIVISKGLMDVFESIIEKYTIDPEFYVFGWKLKPSKKHYDRRYASARYRALRNELGIGYPNVLYSWKYTGIQDHLNAGCNPYDIARQSGHNDLEMIMHYSNPDGIPASKEFSLKAPII